MILSGFSMCCGYYERIKNREISIVDFYQRRYRKIWPYFAFLVLIDIIVTPSFNALQEAFADLTLVFGLLPNAGQISVIGVGWTLGVIFVFYLLFPFFVFLCRSKPAAWGALAVAVLYNYFCIHYFFPNAGFASGSDGRSNFIACSMYFLAGALVYLYRGTICTWSRWIKYGVLTAALVFTIGYFLLLPLSLDPSLKDILLLLLFACWLVVAIALPNPILSNPFTRFMSGVSMEVYLSHMLIFRVIEKTPLGRHFADGGLVIYLITSVLTLTGAVVLAVGFQKAWQWIQVKSQNRSTPTPVA